MGNREIRVGQLIAPFGPGSMYTDRRGTPLIVCGLDHWYKRWDRISEQLVDCESRREFERVELRLSELLRVDRFCIPPDFRHVRRNETPPPNSSLHIPAQRFPTWYRHTKTGQLKQFKLATLKTGSPDGGGRWQPVRFVSVCAAGHLCEFPWKGWINCRCEGGELTLIDQGGADLASVRIKCKTCPEGSMGARGKSLSGTTIRPEGTDQGTFGKAGILCPGERPWLGDQGRQPNCPQPLIGAMINQTNLYFAKTISAISLPVMQNADADIIQLKNEIEADPGAVGAAKLLWSMGESSRPVAVAAVEKSLDSRKVAYEDGQVLEALEGIFSSRSYAPSESSPVEPEDRVLAFRRDEFNIIRNEVDDPNRVPNLRVIQTKTPSELSQWLSKVNLIERLKETRVFYGFDRLARAGDSLADMPDLAMNQLFLHPPERPEQRWLPALEVFGEGIFIELKEERLTEWKTENNAWLAKRMDDRFLRNLGGISQTLPPQGPVTQSWAARYLLVHSLAHVLINQLVFECGYSTASLRERLYVSDDSAAPMAGILIYTAAGDSEGTLGGLVRLGRPELLGPVFQRALGRASWCSADPVCSENLGGQGSMLANIAACHSCILLPETSCETINNGLDRSMLVGTPDNREPGFFSELVDACVLG